MDLAMGARPPKEDAVILATRSDRRMLKEDGVLAIQMGLNRLVVDSLSAAGLSAHFPLVR